jgi:hypothetical protein
MQTVFYNGLINYSWLSKIVAWLKTLPLASGDAIAAKTIKSMPRYIFQLYRQLSLFLSGRILKLALTDGNLLSLIFIADERCDSI